MTIDEELNARHKQRDELRKRRVLNAIHMLYEHSKIELAQERKLLPLSTGDIVFFIVIAIILGITFWPQ